MNLHITLLVEKSAFWEADLAGLIGRSFPGSTLGVSPIESFAPDKLGALVFVSADAPQTLEALSRIDRRGRVIVLISRDADAVPEALGEGLADDVLIHPFRLPEFLGKLRIFEQILMTEEITHANETFSGLIDRFKEDLKLAERLQKARLPSRFKDPKGFKIKARYLAGLKSGGEFFDVADAATHDRLALLLTDSSSYGLSSAVLSVLMRVAAKLTGGDARSCFDTVKAIYDEIMLTLGEKDRLSLFYGSVNRKDLTLSYLNLGSSMAFHCSKKGQFEPLATQGAAISRDTGLRPAKDVQLVLQPEDRLVLLSDGFIESVGGAEGAVETLNRFRKSEPADALNELVFRVKSGLESEDAMPEQDCTGVVLDVDAKFLRIARI
jgi:serine phosphatase RsbU (regulator of sigma subunit)